MDGKQWFDSLSEGSESNPAYVAEGLALDAVIEFGRAMKAQGITQSELARRIGTSPAFVSQTLHGRPNMTFLTLAKFALALGLECTVKLAPKSGSEDSHEANEQARSVQTERETSPVATAASHRPAAGVTPSQSRRKVPQPR